MAYKGSRKAQRRDRAVKVPVVAVGDAPDDVRVVVGCVVKMVTVEGREYEFWFTEGGEELYVRVAHGQLAVMPTGEVDSVRIASI